MDFYKLIIGVLILLIGFIASYLIFQFNRNKKLNSEKQKKIDHNDFLLYIASIGGLIGGLIIIIRELLNL